ncbi:uncharacterized protein MONBRDRAFT_29390 [Monosiga brevicollis MX1]|uniref:Uncharacterized protein n=1 Tax=Monosiga brevicollis TaxID=81824 RepID=A9VAY5_MONBE|nr:uncharacterized protein MONBRDRAFT_29390 [Monosiga brevicollis MX1]EDQ85298.1 predicted protein [Monosiga brevicollis MX1]|eukprot:XP_001749919.1 hypothetical protein [Monosiga brevicollis MX1]
MTAKGGSGSGSGSGRLGAAGLTTMATSLDDLMAGASTADYAINRGNRFPIPAEHFGRLLRNVVGELPDGRQVVEAALAQAATEVLQPGTETGSASSGDLPRASRLTVPSFRLGQDVPTFVRRLQAYLSGRMYNATNMQCFEIDKGKPICRLLETAKLILEHPLPIKCLEAVVVAVHLSNPVAKLARFTISFKTSRRATLMDRPLTFDSLTDLIKTYVSAYADVGHWVQHVRLSQFLSHDPHSNNVIQWRQLQLNLHGLSWDQIGGELDMYVRQMRKGFSPAETRIVRSSRPRRSRPPKSATSSQKTKSTAKEPRSNTFAIRV